MADEKPSSLGDEKNTSLTVGPATAADDTTAAPMNDPEERPSKRLKTATEEASSEPKSAADTSAPVKNGTPVSEPVAQKENQTSNGDAPANVPSGSAREAGDKASETVTTDGSAPLVDNRRHGIAPIKPEYATLILSMHACVH